MWISNNYNRNERKLNLLIGKEELKKNIAKFVFIQNCNNPSLFVENNSVHYLRHLKKNWKTTSKTKFVKRCILTNRGRGVLSKFQVGRTKLRELLQAGVFPGWSKARW